MGTRRSALKRLLAFPGLLGVGLPLQAQDDDLKRLRHRWLGVQTLRFLNTAEHWHKDRANRFVDAMSLAASPTVALMRTHDKTVKAGLGAALIDRLAWGRPEIVPGWGLRLEVSTNGTDYRIALDDLSTLQVGGLRTDTSGLIQSVTSQIGQAHAADVRVVNAVDHRRPGRFAKTVNYLAGLTTGGVSMQQCNPLDYEQFQCWYNGQCCQCNEDSCCVSCLNQCCREYNPSCTNCGCQSCIWSCEWMC